MSKTHRQSVKAVFLAMVLAQVPGGVGVAAADDASAFRCSNLETANEIQLLEGKDGMFFRIIPDIKMFHPFTDATIENVAKFSAALKAGGTTLIYVPVPTKSMILPDLLPEKAKIYGYEPDIAKFIYDEVVNRLEKRGVIAVDIANPMIADAKGKNGDLAFFRTDFHWTAQGARPAAREIAKRLAGLPGFSGKSQPASEPTELPPVKIQSTMHRIVQHYCGRPIPDAQSHPYKFETTSTDIFGEEPKADGTGDIFGNAPADGIVLVGTSFSDMGVSNFANFIEHYTGLPVENYSISGGNQFGSIVSYMTSREFQQKRPKYLIWENPIYNNLAQFGDAPLMEIIAAANADCSQQLAVRTIDQKTVEVDLPAKPLNGNELILADAGDNRGRKVTFQLIEADGAARDREVERGERLRATGRYYLPLNDLVGSTFTKAAITFDTETAPTRAISFCKLLPGELTQ